MLGFIATLALLATTLAQPASAPMEIVNNHVFVAVMLNGAGPFQFIVDSGAGNVIDPAVAAAIGARVHGKVRLIGVGDAIENGSLTSVARVDIGSASFSDQRFIVAATRTTFSAAEGPIVDGLIGRAIIGSGITVFDYANRLLTFFANDEVVFTNDTAVLPVSISDGLPTVPCAISGIASNCIVDTGSRLAISVLGPFVKRHPQVVPSKLSAPGVDGYGIGGAAYGQVALLASLSFGDIVLDNVVADFSLAERGVFATEAAAANVGGGVWRRFTLIFDLPHARIGLRAGATTDQPYAVDRSGLFLIGRGDTIVLLDVRPDTPAARAGLLASDIIVALNGQKYSPEMLPALRAALEAPAGTVITLDIVRGNAPARSIRLRLEQYI